MDISSQCNVGWKVPCRYENNNCPGNRSFHDTTPKPVNQTAQDCHSKVAFCYLSTILTQGKETNVVDRNKEKSYCPCQSDYKYLSKCLSA